MLNNTTIDKLIEMRIKYQDKMYKKYDIRMYNYSFVCI